MLLPMLLAALLLPLTAQSKSGYPLDHLDLLSKEKPFVASIVPDVLPMASVSKIVRYTVHVPFDKVVMAIERQLGPKVWSNYATYEKATLDVIEEQTSSQFFISGKVIIQRGKAIFDAKRPEGVTGIGGTPESLKKFHFPKVDPTDWVTISVIQSIRVQDESLASRLPAVTHSAPKSYCIVWWDAKDRMQRGPVDVHAGTAALEGRSRMMFHFYRAGGA